MARGAHMTSRKSGPAYSGAIFYWAVGQGRACGGAGTGWGTRRAEGQGGQEAGVF